MSGATCDIAKTDSSSKNPCGLELQLPHGPLFPETPGHWQLQPLCFLFLLLAPAEAARMIAIQRSRVSLLGRGYTHECWRRRQRPRPTMERRSPLADSYFWGQDPAQAVPFLCAPWFIALAITLRQDKQGIRLTTRRGRKQWNPFVARPILPSKVEILR
jgi:hypothetical protein